MRRNPAFDPPEYVAWRPLPRLVERFQDTVSGSVHCELIADLGTVGLVNLYRNLLRTRLHDIALKRWVRTGVISKAWLGTGEEAITVGCSAALDPSCDVAAPMIRNAGALHMMGMPLADMFRGYLATADSPNGGRDLHIGRLGEAGQGTVQPISHMGTSATIVAGIALAFKNRGEERVALTWIGDGATKTAAAHEGLVVAASLGVPAVFVIQNNQVALGTPLDQHSVGDLEALPQSYGMAGWSCDGNNVLDVYVATSLAAQRCREGKGPAMVVANTFRMGGHATHDEAEARAAFPPELFREWGHRDPVGLYEEYLCRQGIHPDELVAVEDEVEEEMDAAAAEALASRTLDIGPERALYEGISGGGVLRGLELRPC